MANDTKLFYAKGELLDWVDMMEEAKKLGLRPDDVREFISQATGGKAQ